MPRPRLLASLVLLALAPAAPAGDAPPAEAPLVTPTSRLRLQNFQNYGHFGRVTLAPDGRSLVVPNGNGVTVWDLRPGRRNAQPRFVQMENAYFHDSALALSPDGTTLVGAPAFHMNDSNLRFWELGASKEARQLDNDEPVVSLALSADGKVLAVATQQRLELWEAATGDELRVLSGGGGMPPGNMQQRPVLAFSPDGRMLAATGADNSLILWETATGRERQRIRMRRPPLPPMMNGFRQPSPHPAASLALSAGGRLLAAGGADNAVHLWDLRSGRELPPLGEHGAPVQGVAFPPGGRELVTFDAEGVRLAWDVRRLLRAAAPGPGTSARPRGDGGSVGGPGR